mgnify:CR=1 FL=1
MTVLRNMSCIAALSTNRLIGAAGALPWHLPKDLQTFKRLTLGKPVLMGRKTYTSIGRPLPKRENLVLSRSSDAIDGVQVFRDLASAVGSVASEQELMVIGGGEIYRLCLPMANRLYLSVVEGDFEGDAYFPALETDTWRVTEMEHYPRDERNDHSFTLYTLNREGTEVAQIPTFLFD